MLSIVFSILTFILILASLGAVLTLHRYFHSPPTEYFNLPSLSLMVPLKGVDAHTLANLNALVESHTGAPLQFLLVMETDEDPVFAICQQVKESHRDVDILVILSGPAGERMGKMHNLAAAARFAQHEMVGSIDADVVVEADTLAACLSTLDAEGVDVVCSLPYYDGDGALGGKLVAAYANYFFGLNVGALAVKRWAPVVIGSLWMMRREMLPKTGGLDTFTGYISDDAAVGRAVSAAGGRIGISRRAVKVPLEDLGLCGGFAHLQKWVAMLRAEGLGTYLEVVGTWHILWVALLGVLTAGLSADNRLLPLSLGMLLAAVLVRVGSVLALNQEVYPSVPRWRFVGAVLAYEALVAPVLFAIGFFKRTLDWREKTYKIGKGRVIKQKQ